MYLKTSAMTKTLGAATVALGLMAGVAATRTPKTEKDTVEADRKEVVWDSSKSYVDNTIENAKTIGSNTVQATIDLADKTTESENTIPLGAAAALAGLGFVGSKAIDKRKQVKKEAEAEAEAFERNKREEMLKRQAEDEKRSAEIKAKYEAEQLEAKRIAKLSKLDERMAAYSDNMRQFDFEYALKSFGVSDTKKPIKKFEGEGLTPFSHLHGLQKYTEYYQSEDGKIIEAGIKSYAPRGISAKEYNYAYVRVINPTESGKVCEMGRVHLTDKDGKAVEYNTHAKVCYYTQYSSGSVDRYITVHNAPEVKSDKVYVTIPAHEQLNRDSIKFDAVLYGLGPFHDNTYNKEDKALETNIRRELFNS